MSYNAGGVVLWSYDNGVEATASYTASPNMAVPTAMTANTGLTSSMSWNSFLGLASESGPNGDTASTGYDSYARPASTTSATGAVTTYTYATAAPWTVTATTNGRWSRTTLDGFGRTVKGEQGNGPTTSTPVSVAETTYEACGCSAVGKTKSVSMPHASGAGSVWTTYVYDALGRTTGVTNPDGSAKSYQYVANTVTVTDEAGKWKKYWMDGYGNLTQVQEPDPANPGSSSYYTYYTYDLLGHCISVNMPRPTGTQTRTFNYGTPPGPYLLSATNPENGTVSYTYTWYGAVETKTDAKNQQVRYTYDDYRRLTQVSYYYWFWTGQWMEDTAARVTMAYDTNGVDGTYSQYASG
jgi:YD repeat-containing protein